MDFSLFLAKVMGLYFIIISLSVLINKNRMVSIINGIVGSPALQFVMGLNILVIGLLLIVSHPIWVSTWQVMITVVAWLVFIKGLINIAFPHLAQSMTKPFIQS